jgi:xylan 1,4-beta-xylosidase
MSKRLSIAYERLHNMTSGSTQTAALNLTLGSPSRVDESSQKVFYPGDYSMLGDTQPLAVIDLTLTAAGTVLKKWP